MNANFKQCCRQRTPLARAFGPLLSAALLLAIVAGAHGQTVDTPLSFDLNYTPDLQRLRIDLNIGGASRTENYELDTGSSPLTSVWTSGAPWWGVYTETDTTSRDIVYGPGSGQNKYDYHLTSADITLSSADASASLSSGSSTIVQIYGAYTNADTHHPAVWVKNTQFDSDVAAAVTDPSKEPFQSVAYGLLGADLTDPHAGLYGIINSLTFSSSVTKGFTLNGNTSAPTLTIGISNTAPSYNETFAMNMSGTKIQQALIDGSYSVTSGTDSLSFSNVSTLLDSGTPPSSRVVIHLGTDIDISSDFLDGDFLADGVSLTFNINDAPYTLTSDEDHRISVYAADSDTDKGSITYGLNFFQNYSVTYDLGADQVDILAVPEPSAALLAIAGAAMLAVLRMRWRRAD